MTEDVAKIYVLCKHSTIFEKNLREAVRKHTSSHWINYHIQELVSENIEVFSVVERDRKKRCDVTKKRIETLFSQMCDQFIFIRNYEKDVKGIFTESYQ